MAFQLPVHTAVADSLPPTVNQYMVDLFLCCPVIREPRESVDVLAVIP